MFDRGAKFFPVFIGSAGWKSRLCLDSRENNQGVAQKLNSDKSARSEVVAEIRRLLYEENFSSCDNTI